jgi:hypothetical protein
MCVYLDTLSCYRLIRSIFLNHHWLIAVDGDQTRICAFHRRTRAGDAQSRAGAALGFRAGMNASVLCVACAVLVSSCVLRVS